MSKTVTLIRFCSRTHLVFGVFEGSEQKHAHFIKHQNHKTVLTNDAKNILGNLIGFTHPTCSYVH